MKTNLTASEAAAILGVTPQYATRLMVKGRLRGEKHAGVWFVEKREVERFKKLPPRPAGRPKGVKA